MSTDVDTPTHPNPTPPAPETETHAGAGIPPTTPGAPGTPDDTWDTTPAADTPAETTPGMDTPGEDVFAALAAPPQPDNNTPKTSPRPGRNKRRKKKTPAPGAPAGSAPTQEPAADTSTFVDVSTDVDTASPNPGTPAPASDAGEPKQRRRRGGPMVISGQIDMPGGVRLTGRDYQLLAFLGRYKVATVTQIARYFKTSESAMRNRLPRLERAGLLGWAYTGQAKPKAWTVTETGLKVASVALSAPHIKWGTLRHTFGLVDLGITFEHADETVVTEREIRAAARDVPTSRLHGTLLTHISPDGEEETRDAADTYIIPIKGRQLGHIPDMVLARPPYPSGASGFIAIELELHRKNIKEWQTILTAYRDTPLYDKVVYYTPDRDIRRALKKHITQLNAAHRISIEHFTPLETAADPTIHTRLD